MRMRELEQRTGVGRETIRYYIREGLLPEPARASRNSASYSDTHVARLKAIKALQEERFLPLAVIKTLLDETGDPAPWLAPLAFPQLDALLRARFDAGAARVPVAVLAAQLGVEAEHLGQYADDGLITVAPDGSVSARDAAIMRALASLRAAGFDEAHGFLHGQIKLYTDFIEWLTNAEMRLFFDQTAGKIGDAEAADMAAGGISAVNELLSLLRTRALLAKLEARRRIANDNA